MLASPRELPGRCAQGSGLQARIRCGGRGLVLAGLRGSQRRGRASRAHGYRVLVRVPSRIGNAPLLPCGWARDGRPHRRPRWQLSRRQWSRRPRRSGSSRRGFSSSSGRRFSGRSGLVSSPTHVDWHTFSSWAVSWASLDPHADRGSVERAPVRPVPSPSAGGQESDFSRFRGTVRSQGCAGSIRIICVSRSGTEVAV